MVLSDSRILEELEAGNIIIGNFNQKYLNPNSVDLTLAPTCKVYIREYIEAHNEKIEKPLDPRKENPTKEIIIPEEGMILVPGEVYLYACNERIGVKNNIRAKVEGKSSLGRLGLFVHVTAGFIDTGFEGSLVLELVATRPILVYPNMKICQVEFAYVEGKILETYDIKSGSKYHNQKGVQESLYHKNFAGYTIKIEEFISRFKPELNDDTGLSYMYRPIGLDLKKVYEALPNKVWSLMKEENNNYIKPGYNRDAVGFYITQYPYNESEANLLTVLI